jgi:pyruvate/2-oxoacid:ferredoxin oxidoreductase beta subunit
MASIDLGLLAVSRRDAYIAQGSIAAPAHLAASLAGAFSHRGPSLLHLYAPSPRRHGFATDRTLDRARAAFQARLLPLFRYDPAPRACSARASTSTAIPNPTHPGRPTPTASAHPRALGAR